MSRFEGEENFAAGMSTLGNTAGTTGTVDQQLIIVGGSNVSLSQSRDGQYATLTINAAAGGGGAGTQTLGMSNIGNTSGTTGVATGTNVQFLFAGGNNITLSQSINGASGTITISGPHTSQFLTTAALSGDSTKYAGVGETVGTIAGTDLAMTVNTDGVSIGYPKWITTAALSNHSHGDPTLNLTNLSGTTASNSAGFTLSLSNVAPIPLATTGKSVATANSVGTVTRYAAEDHAHEGIYAAGVSNVGNTAGDTVVQAGRVVFAGGDNITLSVGTAANALQTITVIGGAGGAAGSNTLGMSNLGNTSGTSGVISGSAIRYLLAGGNNITLSQSINGVSATVTISGGDAVTAIGVSNLGNTASQTGMVDARMVLVGSNNITLSQAADAGFNSATVTIYGPNPGAQNMSFWQNMGVNGSATDAMAQTGTSHGQLKVFQMDIGNNIFAGDMTVSTMLVDMTCNRTATIGNFSWYLHVGIYTLAGSQMILKYSASTSIGSSQSSGASFNVSSVIHGKRYLTFNGSTQFSTMDSTGGNAGLSALTLTQGLYYMAMLPLSSSNTFSASFYGAILGESGQRSGTFGASQTVGTATGAFPWMGVMTQTTNAMPQSLPNSSLMKTNLEAIFIPHVVFNNLAGLTQF